MRRWLRAPLLGVILIGAACEDSTGPGRGVDLRIEALEAPTTVAPNAPVEVIVTIVLGGCLSFTRLEVARTASLLTITARGYDVSGPHTFCTGDIRYERIQHIAQPPFTDPLAVVAKQPDGTELTRQVRVQ